jgi:hypothetical protein
MKEAVSMYLGGFVVKADDCDHDSAKQWGLKCPFCDSAVFLRSQSIRKIKGEDAELSKNRGFPGFYVFYLVAANIHLSQAHFA